MRTTRALPMLLLGLWLMTCNAQAALPQFESVNIAGQWMQLPIGWQRQQDDYSLILTENPHAEESPVVGLIAVAAPPGTAMEPRQVAELILEQMALPAHGFAVIPVEERRNASAVYRLHHLSKEPLKGYLASLTYADSASGGIIHLFFSATDERFAAMGGVMFPMVVFGGLDRSVLEQTRQQAVDSAADDVDRCAAGGTGFEVCLADQWFSPGGRYAVPRSSGGSVADSYAASCERMKAGAKTALEMQQAMQSCERMYTTASQILSMQHNISMGILHNIGGGWCRRGEPGCW